MTGLRQAVTLGILVALLAVAGCDEVETELMLNADGSGTMVQRLKLSPAAYTVAKQSQQAEQGGYSFILDEEDLQQWRDENRGGSPTVLSFTSNLEDDGSYTAEYEIAFNHLQELAASSWGWPLQIGLIEADENLELRFDDPVRVIQRELAIAELQALTNPPPDTPAGRGEYAACLEATRQLSEGSHIRTIIHLPAPAISAKGATLSDDKTTATYDVVLGEKKTPFETWLGQSGAAVAIAPYAMDIQPFPVPMRAGARTSPTVRLRSVGPESGYVFELSSARIQRNRSMQYRNEQTNKEDSLSISMQFYAPVDAEFVRNQGDNRRGHVLLEAIDQDGNPLEPQSRSRPVSFYVHSYGRSHHRDPDQQCGEASMSFNLPEENPTLIKRLRGYVVTERIVEYKKVEIKPLKENLNKVFEIGEEKLYFTSVEKNEAKYVITRLTTRRNPSEWLQMEFFSGMNVPISSSNRSSSGSENSYTCTIRFQNEDFPEDGYVTISYPAKVEKIRIPFSFEDVKLP